MDSSRNLRMITEEEILTMQDLLHPVETVADIPDWKLAEFKLVDEGINRKSRKKIAKKNRINWHEYQVYRQLVK